MLNTMLLVFNQSLKLFKLWFFSVWCTPEVAAGGRICWRKKWSALLTNGPSSSFSYINNSSIITTVTLVELPSLLQPLYEALHGKPLFWTCLRLLKWNRWLNFQLYIKICPSLLLWWGDQPFASSSITRKSS